MNKFCLILTDIQPGSPTLNVHPAYSYLLHAAETWIADDDKKNVMVLVEPGDHAVLKEISDFTQLDVMPLKEDLLEGCTQIRLNVNYPLLSGKIWRMMAGANEKLAVVSRNGDLIASLEPGHSVHSRLIQNGNSSGDSNDGITRVVANDPISGLNVSVESEKVMAEAVVKSGHYPIHPIRYLPPYDLSHSEENPCGSGKIPLLFSAPSSFFNDRIKKEWESLFEITYAWNAPKHVTQKLLVGKEVWVTGTCPPYRIDRAMMEASPSLRLIATPSTGTNHIDVKAAKELDIPVCSIKTSEFLKDIHASSEHSFALLLAMMKKLNIVTDEARFGHWREREEEFRTVELHGRSIGLIGYGRIGSNMARYCHTFGMKVIVFDPFKEVAEPWVEQVNTREELLESSEIVSLHYHLTEETRNSFGSDDFSRMRDGSCFLNTARGELVDEMAMIEALKSGKLKAAAVDVISDEDRLYKWDHPVIAAAREYKNLIVSPHTAGLTVDSESKAAMEILNEIKAHLKL